MGRGTVVRLRYVHHYIDEHGQERWYFRRPGFKKVRLPGRPGTKEFESAYHRAYSGAEPKEIGQNKAPSGSVAAAIAAYYKHNSFTLLAPGTQKMRRAILERIRAKHGSKSLATIQPHHISQTLGTLKPFAARNWLKTLRGLMQFAVAVHLRNDDPTVGIKPPKANAGTFHTWTEDEISLFERHHEIGSRARLALALLLFTAARRSDAVLFGPQHIRGGRLHYRQQKTGRTLAIPVHPLLARIIDASPPKHLTFLVTASGKPFTPAGFGNWFRQACNEAGLPHCSAHGLRKAQARRLAEAGCTVHEIAAITGHKTLSEVQRYTEAAEQARLADAAMQNVSETRIGSLETTRAKAAK